MLSKDFKEFVELLEKHHVEYLIVGGYAVGQYGYPRYTGDLDIWINPTSKNYSKILMVLKDFGFSSMALSEDDFYKLGNMIQLGYPPLRIDILNEIDGVEFTSCFSKKNRVKSDGMEMNFISYDDLISNKKASGRYKDLDDIENMKKD